MFLAELDRLLPFVVFVIAYSLGSYVFLREPKPTINRLFVFIILAPFVDDFIRILPSFGLVSTRSFTNVSDMTFIILPPLYLHFALALNERKLPRFVPFLIYAPPAVLFYMALSNPQGTFVAIALVIYTTLAFLEMINGYLKAETVLEQKQRFYIILGLVGNFIYLLSFAIANFLFGANMEKGQMISPLIVVLFVASALLKFRVAIMLNIIRKSLVYAVAILLFLAVYVILARSAELYITPSWNISTGALQIALLIFFVLLFQPVVELARFIIDRHLFKSRYNYRLILERFSKEVVQFLEIGKIVELTRKTVYETLGIEGIFFLFAEDVRSLYSDSNAPPHLATLLDVPEGGEMPSYLRKLSSMNEPAFVLHLAGDRELSSIASLLLEARVSLLITLVVEKRLMGIICLAGKELAEMLDDEDLLLLQTIANQISVAINNAVTYESLRRANMKLSQTIVDLQKAKDELDRKERLAALGKLAATIAHEVRNPLGIIKVSAATLRDSFTEEKPRSLASFINDEVDRLNVVVSELLDFARNRAPEKVPVKPCELLEECISTLAPALEGKKISVKLECPADLPCINADPAQLRQAFYNILINAVHAVGAEGEITVEVNRQGDYFIFIFRDNGPGIEKSLLPKLFEPFFTTKQKGAGLGLAITNQIVEGHNGKITVSSEPGRGTEFVVTLPGIISSEHTEIHTC